MKIGTLTQIQLKDKKLQFAPLLAFDILFL